MNVNELLERFSTVASDPKRQLDSYIAQGKKVVLTAPVYTPEEIIHAMGLIPIGAWGGDLELEGAKRYFPAFICSITQSIVELGMRGAYDGASAIVIPSLCDSLKVLGQNWKYAVPSIPFIPMTYPQNRRPEYGVAFTVAGYRRVITELEHTVGAKFDEAALANSIAVYNAHSAAMRRLSAVLARRPEVLPSQRANVLKSAWFMEKGEHTALAEALITALETQAPGQGRIPIAVSGILASAPGLTALLDEYGMYVVCDDVAAESRQYRTDTPPDGTPLERLARKFAGMDCCSVLYDVDKKRPALVAEEAGRRGAKGVLILMTKFCDPEEFDYPLLKRACEAVGLPVATVEVDRQMVNYEQARTVIEAFRDLLV